MTLLTQPEADELTVFFEYEFKSEEEFEKFVWAYADYFEVVEDNIESSKELITNLQKYRLNHSSTIESKEGEYVDVSHIDQSKTRVTQFFHDAKYKIVSGNATEVDSIVTVDATCVDLDKEGKQIQVNFSDENLLQLRVIQNLGDNEFKLMPLERKDYAIKVEGFKTYILSGKSVFIYHRIKNALKLRRHE